MMALLMFGGVVLLLIFVQDRCQVSCVIDDSDAHGDSHVEWIRKRCRDVDDINSSGAFLSYWISRLTN